MDDPREEKLPEPKDMLQRIKIFARDLAFGYRFGDFPERYTVNSFNDDEFTQVWYVLGAASESFDEYLRRKWENKPPTAEMLEQFGYLKILDDGQYIITPSAFDLLNDMRDR